MPASHASRLIAIASAALVLISACGFDAVGTLAPDAGTQPAMPTNDAAPWPPAPGGPLSR